MQTQLCGPFLEQLHLLFAELSRGTFCSFRREVTGGPVPLVEGVRTDSGTAHYSFSATGSLVYVPGPLTGAANQDLALIDRKGDAQALKLPIGRYDTPRVSPDGRHVAFGVDEGNEQMVWVYDLAGTASVRRLTFGGKNRFPIWSADSQRVAFQSDRQNDSAVFWQRADGTGTAERLTKPEQGTVHVPESWSPDGRYVLVGVTKGSNFSLWTLLLQDKKMAPFEGVQSTAPINATFSPDGRWVAYQSTETGMSQIYVQPFPPTGAKYQISKTNGNSIYPLWSRDGKELFSIPAPRQFVAVSVTTKPSFAFSNPTTMARSVFMDGGPPTVRNYDAARDGRIKAAGIVSGAAGEAAPRRRCDSDGARRAVVADRLASYPHGREAGYAHPMASKGFPVVLALEVTASRKTAIAGRPTAADCCNGGGESNLGRGGLRRNSC